MIAVTLIPAAISAAIHYHYIPSYIGIAASIALMVLIGQRAGQSNTAWKDTIRISSDDETVIEAREALSSAVKTVSVGCVSSSLLAGISTHQAMMNGSQVELIIGGIIAGCCFFVMLKEYSDLDKVYTSVQAVYKARSIRSGASKSCETERRLAKIEKLIIDDADRFMENMQTLNKAQEETLAMLKAQEKRTTKKL